MHRLMGAAPGRPGKREEKGRRTQPSQTTLQLKRSLPLLWAPELQLARPAELRDLTRLNEKLLQTQMLLRVSHTPTHIFFVPFVLAGEPRVLCSPLS